MQGSAADGRSQRLPHNFRFRQGGGFRRAGFQFRHEVFVRHLQRPGFIPVVHDMLGHCRKPPFRIIFCLKRCAFQTIRPVISRKKRSLSARFWPQAALCRRIWRYRKSAAARDGRSMARSAAGGKSVRSGAAAGSRRNGLQSTRLITGRVLETGPRLCRPGSPLRA